MKIIRALARKVRHSKWTYVATLVFVVCLYGQSSIVFKPQDTSVTKENSFIYDNYRMGGPKTDITYDETSVSNETKMCRSQHVEYNGSFVRSHYKISSKADCSANKQIIDVQNGSIHYLLPDKSCHGKLVRRRTDRQLYEVDYGILKEGQKMPEPFMSVRCEHGHHTGLASSHRDQDLIRKLRSAQKAENMNLNIFMLSFDSVSLANALYHLPLTMKYIQDDMNAVIMQDYTIVGDGTPQAMLPIFTGKKETEMPSTRREDRNGTFLDRAYKMINYEFMDNGYLTTFFERLTTYPMFGMRLRGFDKAPAHFYSLPYFAKTEQAFKDACFRDKQEYEYNLDFHRELLHGWSDVPKFFFVHNTVTHATPGYLANTDEFLLGYFKFLNQPEIRNNTFIIFMGDHGPRYGELRKTYEGRLEERSPLFSVMYPDWFNHAYPEAVRNLKLNSERLTSPFDIHPTLKHLLYGLPKTHQTGELSSRSISLFHEIPLSRTCDNAGIAAHWCRCLREENIDPEDPLARAAAQAVITKINLLTDHLRDLCMPLALDRVETAALVVPEDGLLRFVGAKDKHGFDYQFEDQVEHPRNVQLVFKTHPAGSIYEATVSIDSASNMIADERVISIVSKYGDLPNCIKEAYPNLRKFCVCHDKATNIKNYIKHQLKLNEIM